MEGQQEITYVLYTDGKKEALYKPLAQERQPFVKKVVTVLEAANVVDLIKNWNLQTVFSIIDWRLNWRVN